VFAIFSQFTPLTIHASDGNFVWAKQLGGADFDFGEAMAADAAGNLYITGSIWGTADFDPGPDVHDLVPADGPYDGFIVKLNRDGELVWVKHLVTPDGEGFAIAVDASGFIYVTGRFYNTADFDPGPGVFNMTSAGDGDIFVTKLDNSGNFVWSKRLGGTGFDRGRSISVDGSGNVYTAGDFKDAADFDPGPDTYNLVSSSNAEKYVSKLTSSGDFVWAKRIGGGPINAYKLSVAADNAGNVYASGSFEGTHDFDPGLGYFGLTSAGQDDAFLMKLNIAGNFEWAKSWGGMDIERCYAVAVDKLGNVYATGSFFGTADFDPGPGTYNFTSAGSDIFVSKFSTTGELAWAQQVGGSESNSGHAIALDGSGNIYLAGSAGGYLLSAKLTNTGNLIWTVQSGQMGFIGATTVAADEWGKLYTAGLFADTVEFDPGPGATYLTSAGEVDIFLAKFSGSPAVAGVELAGVQPSAGSTVDYVITFSDAVTGVDTSDFVVSTTGTVDGAFVTNISGSDTTFTVTVNIGIGTGTIRLDLIDDDSVVNDVANPLGGAGAGNGDFTMGEVYNVDKSLPVNWLYVILALATAGTLAAWRIQRIRSQA
jgi:outer membrane protein assembly factor BamB